MHRVVRTGTIRGWIGRGWIGGRVLSPGEGIQTARWLRLMLVPVVLVFGLVLGHVARWFADGMAVNAQLYFHAFRPHNVRTPWVLAPLHFLSAAVLQYSALASWAVAFGYLGARAVAHRCAIAMVGGFAALTFLGTALTTTSVRVAQPWFFETVPSSTAYPAAIKAIFLVTPAYFAARAAHRQTTPVLAVAMIAAIGIVLAGWNAPDLGHALTYGCVVQTSAGVANCTSRESLWGMGTALTLASASGLMAWDSWVRGTR